MPYCPNCGGMVNVGDRFCASCGTALQTVTAPVSAVNGARSDYRIVLISRGTCSRAVAIDMLSDLLGYSDPDAARIIDNAPMEAALGLTAIQAQYISQAITEYGMQVAIYNSDGYVDMGSKATASVYNNEGSILDAVASVLTGLTVANRISTFNRWTKPAPVVFRPVYRRPAPPPAYRRRRPTPPRPTPIPVVHHAPRPVPVAPPAPPRAVANSRPEPVRHPAPTPHSVPNPRPNPVPSPRPNPMPGPMPGPMKGPGGAGRGGPMGSAGGRRG